MNTPDELLLDVSDLPPPEPLIRILDAVDAEGFTMARVLHRQEPCLLYPQLEKRGLSYRILTSETGRFEMRIFREEG
jgi:hypothetical protein